MWSDWLGVQEVEGADELIDAVLLAHKQAAMANPNASSNALYSTSQLKVPFSQAVASALLTLGGPLHGPMSEARELIYGWAPEDIKASLDLGEKIPGWGNSFHDELDPSWVEVDKIVREKFANHATRLDAITSLIEDVKKQKIYPNAAGYTAVTAHIVGLPLGLESLFFILGRLPAWAVQHHGATKA
jgi:citrate synthase